MKFVVSVFADDPMISIGSEISRVDFFSQRVIKTVSSKDVGPLIAC